MLAAILSIFTSSGLGAIVGMVGSWLTKREERKNMAMKFDHDYKMATLRKEETEIESEHELALADKQIERSETEGKIKADIEEMEAFREGLREQQRMYKIKWVDAIRGIMRPVITVYLLAVATYFAINVGRLVGGLEALTPKEILMLYKDIISQIMFLVNVAVTWWFGSRPSSQRNK